MLERLALEVIQCVGTGHGGAAVVYALRTTH
jgi:hypothetical protein